MIRCRAAFDALQKTSQTCWLTVRTCTGSLLEVRQLAPETDLVRAFLAAMLELIDAGGRIGEFSSGGGAVRHSRGLETRMLAIEVADPEEGGRHGPAWSGRCVNCED